MGGFYAYSSFNCFECIMNTVIWQIIVLQKKKKKKREKKKTIIHNNIIIRSDKMFFFIESVTFYEIQQFYRLFLFSNKISPWLSIQRKLKWNKEIYRYKNNANLTYNSKRHPNKSRYELSNSLHDPFSMIEPRSFHREQETSAGMETKTSIRWLHTITDYRATKCR